MMISRETLFSSTRSTWLMFRQKLWHLPGLVNIQKAIENGPFIVELSIENGDFP